MVKERVFKEAEEFRAELLEKIKKSPRSAYSLFREYRRDNPKININFYHRIVYNLKKLKEIGAIIDAGSGGAKNSRIAKKLYKPAN